MKATFALPLALSAFGLLTAVGGASAQSFSIDRFALGGGGGTGTGGRFSLSGVAGQPEATPQPLAGGSFSLAGGFWSLAAEPTAGTPMLAIERQGANVRVSWPLTATGFVLDQSLAVTGLWSQVAFPYVTNATDISVSAPAPAGSTFYRLRRL